MKTLLLFSLVSLVSLGGAEQAALPVPYGVGGVTPACARSANCRVVMDFMRALTVQKDSRAVARFVADDFKSNNPDIKGKAGMTGFADFLKKEQPNARVVRTIHMSVDGDLVTNHYEFTSDPAKARVDLVVVDFFRVRNGQIVEYWDVLREVKPAR